MEPEAIINEKMAVLCPICGRKCGELCGNEVVQNFRIRCRGSRQMAEPHFFILNFPTKQKAGV